MKKFSLFAFALAVVGPVMKLLFNFKTEGQVPSCGKMIICANHSSSADPVLLSIAIKRQVCFMAKIELFRNILFAAVLKTFKAFPVSRGEQDKKAINTSVEILENDGILGVFLEGTRSKDGELLKPKAGAAMLAYRTCTPVLPVCIGRIGGGPVRIFHKTKISIGTLIYPKEVEKAGRAELKEMTNDIMAQIAKMKESITCER